MEDVRREMVTMKEALKGKALATIDELIQRMNHLFARRLWLNPYLTNLNHHK